MGSNWPTARNGGDCKKQKHRHNELSPKLLESQRTASCLTVADLLRHSRLSFEKGCSGSLACFLAALRCFFAVPLGDMQMKLWCLPAQDISNFRVFATQFCIVSKFLMFQNFCFFPSCSSKMRKIGCLTGFAARNFSQKPLPLQIGKQQKQNIYKAPQQLDNKRRTRVTANVHTCPTH